MIDAGDVTPCTSSLASWGPTESPMLPGSMVPRANSSVTGAQQELSVTPFSCVVPGVCGVHVDVFGGEDDEEIDEEEPKLNSLGNPKIGWAVVEAMRRESGRMAWTFMLTDVGGYR